MRLIVVLVDRVNNGFAGIELNLFVWIDNIIIDYCQALKTNKNSILLSIHIDFRQIRPKGRFVMKQSI